MKYIGRSNYLKRQALVKYEFKYLILKSLICDLKLSSANRQYFYSQLFNLPRNAYSARIKNSCVFTDRSRFVLRRFKMSRVKLRRVISLGEVCGISKYSW